MTETSSLTQAAIAEFESEFADHLALAADSQDLLFRAARTANTFSAEPVSDDQIRAIYDLVKYAPTAANSQPLRIAFVRSPEAKERLLPLMSDGNRAKTGTAPVTAILAADTDFHEELPKVFPHAGAAFRDSLAQSDDARVAMARLSAGLQIGYFIVGVRAAGLAAGPMTGFDAAAVSKEFFPDGKHEALVIVNIGKPGENPWYDRNPRLDFDEVATIL
ncbi:malonic semialdehyde reductase [Microlunatus sp. Gsoil 973]|uniref:malonic semialdehyde reductase n=1 Tax=Microlunatus sp. Gsoil 973 TaxID=2672569 RepID=UPI0012B4B168|nr:malonic semialdehyde reductase [Microlunatus sp. Gsoil 973]QGN33619.1 malonic semialdehyde reductase [Microlunatus sp. Gsoil 973]